MVFPMLPTSPFDATLFHDVRFFAQQWRSSASILPDRGAARSFVIRAFQHAALEGLGPVPFWVWPGWLPIRRGGQEWVALIPSVEKRPFGNPILGRGVSAGSTIGLPRALQPAFNRHRALEIQYVSDPFTTPSGWTVHHQWMFLALDQPGSAMPRWLMPDWLSIPDA